MNPISIAEHSAHRATEEAIRLWALGSAEYPIDGGSLIQRYSEMAVVDSVTEFATNGRRALEVCQLKEDIYLKQPRWIWKPTQGYAKVGELRDAFNRIIHAQQLEVGFEKSAAKTCMGGGGVVIPYILARTDRKELSYIDLFAMAHAWLFQVLPSIHAPKERDAQQDAP